MDHKQLEFHACFKITIEIEQLSITTSQHGPLHIYAAGVMLHMPVFGPVVLESFVEGSSNGAYDEAYTWVVENMPLISSCTWLDLKGV